VSDRPLRFEPRAVAPLDPPLPADVFTISFSSGSTGTPKGLLMSQAGIENTIAMSAAAWQVRPGEDDILIVAPFSTFQQRYFAYLAVTWGFDLSVVAPERLFQQLRILEPTIVIGPPSFFETLEHRVRSASGRKAWRHRLAAALHRVGPGRSTAWLRSRLGRPWAAVYGGRVRLMLTGSAPVGASTVRVFQQLGLPLYEVYGSTEAGWISFNLPGHNRIGTAGRPVDGVEVTLGDEDEILVRSRAPQAVGYRFEGEETAASYFLADGWIATGDVGRFVGRGFLELVGRRRNTLITRSGVKINPEPLERALEAHASVERAMVLLNDQASALRAVVWLADADDDADDADGRRSVEEHVEALNAAGGPAQRIVQLVTRPASEVTVETGLLTRNFKFDRAAAAARVFERERVGR
jgi:long-subunit acyl-CoA synthetase (AMP-forming)